MCVYEFLFMFDLLGFTLYCNNVTENTEYRFTILKIIIYCEYTRKIIKFNLICIHVFKSIYIHKYHFCLNKWHLYVKLTD